MLVTPLVRKAIALQLHFTSARALHTMATPVQNFSLDRSIFNDSLYARLNTLWFDGVSDTATTATTTVMLKWYGRGSEEDKTAFDNKCKDTSIAALDSIAPNKLYLPPFKSHQDDELNAKALSTPLLREVTQAKGEKQAAETTLALLLLLDQMPRNIFRDQATLPRVYNHYDRLSLALFRSVMTLTPNPIEYPPHAHRPVVKMWLFMPLMHSEALSAHEQWKKYFTEMMRSIDLAGDKDAHAQMQAGLDAEEKHAEPLRRFGRYPHRNECLDREHTPEEIEYLKTADTFGVKQQGGQAAVKKDEL